MERVPGNPSAPSVEHLYPDLPADKPFLSFACCDMPPKESKNWSDKDYGPLKGKRPMRAESCPKPEMFCSPKAACVQRLLQFGAILGALGFIAYHLQAVEQKEIGIRKDIRHMTKVRQINVEKMSKVIMRLDTALRSPAAAKTAQACSIAACAIPCVKGKASKFSKFLVAATETVSPVLKMMPGLPSVIGSALQSLSKLGDTVTNQPYTTQSSRDCGLALGWNEATESGKNPLLALSYNPENPWQQSIEPIKGYGKGYQADSAVESNEIPQWGGVKKKRRRKPLVDKEDRKRKTREKRHATERTVGEERLIAERLSDFWKVERDVELSDHESLVQVLVDIFEQYGE